MASELPTPSPDVFPEAVTDAPNTSRPEFEALFDALVTRHYASLCTFAWRFLHARDAAEDAVQEVLHKIWHRRSIESVDDPVPYLYQAVRNQCLMALRRDRRWNTIAIDANDTRYTAPSNDPALVDLQDAIARAIDALPERTRLVFAMHRQQHLTYGDIARILGISIKTVETQMTRALKSLRRQLDPFFCVGTAVLSALEWWPHLFR